MYKIKDFGWSYVSNKEHVVVFPKEFEHVLSARRVKVAVPEFNDEKWAWELKVGGRTMWGFCEDELETIDTLNSKLTTLISSLLVEVEGSE